MTRPTSALVVSALMRRVFAGGGFAAVLSRGVDEAGAIFLVIRERNGAASLYGPAAQTAYDEERPDERRFRLFQTAQDPLDEAIEQRLEKERRFDPDLWVVELEGGPPLEDLVSLADEAG